MISKYFGSLLTFFLVYSLSASDNSPSKRVKFSPDLPGYKKAATSGGAIIKEYVRYDFEDSGFDDGASGRFSFDKDSCSPSAAGASCAMLPEDLCLTSATFAAFATPLSAGFKHPFSSPLAKSSGNSLVLSSVSPISHVTMHLKSRVFFEDVAVSSDASCAAAASCLSSVLDESSQGDSEELESSHSSSSKPAARKLFASPLSSDPSNEIKNKLDGVSPSILDIHAQLNHIEKLICLYLATPNNDVTKTPSKVVDLLSKIKGPLREGSNQTVFKRLMAHVSTVSELPIDVCTLTPANFSQNCLRGLKKSDARELNGRIDYLLRIIGDDERCNLELLVASETTSPTACGDKRKRITDITCTQLASAVKMNPKKFSDLSQAECNTRLLDAYRSNPSPSPLKKGLRLARTLPVSPIGAASPSLPHLIFDTKHIVDGNTKGGKHVISESEKESLLKASALTKGQAVLENASTGVLIGFVDDKVSSIFPGIDSEDSFLEFCTRHINQSAELATSIVNFDNGQQNDRKLYAPNDLPYMIEVCFKHEEPFRVTTAYPVFIHKQLPVDFMHDSEATLTLASCRHLYVDEKDDEIIITSGELKELLSPILDSSNEYFRSNNLHGEYVDHATGCTYLIVDIAPGLMQSSKFPHAFGVYVSVPKGFL